jgi:hypothetical protein
MIPKILHFTWLVPAAGREFNVHHMASVRSAHFYNPDFKIKFHCNELPASSYFEDIKDIIEVNFVDTPEEVFGIPIKYMAMKADVLRLRILIEEGGVYQDPDVIAMRSYEDLLNNEVCLGYELSPKLNFRQVLHFLRTLNFDVIKYKFRIPVGLCSGFIMTEKKSIFITDWYEGYRNFNNEDWSYFPVKLPYIMYKTRKYNIHTISPYQAHFPSCAPEDLKIIFEKTLVIKDKYFLHTWESKSYQTYLMPLTKEKILAADNTYCNAIKKFI